MADVNSTRASWQSLHFKEYQNNISNDIKTSLQTLQIWPSMAEIRNVQGFLLKLRDDLLVEVCD